MDIIILDSAYKHGITQENILTCLYNVRGGKILDDPPPKRLVAGFDNNGNALELIVVEGEERLVVIHAMKLQKKYQYLLGRRFMMDINSIDVDKIVNEVYTAEDEGRTRTATYHETMRLRLAALAALVRNMQETVEKDHKLVSTYHAKGV